MRTSIVRFIGFITFLVCLLGLSFLYYHDVRPTGLTTFLSSPFQRNEGFNNLLSKEPKVFHITATENNLGIVEVRFMSLKRIEDYGLVFRIKQSGDDTWYYEHVYYFNPFVQNGLYPFGFPTVVESKGKEFEIEIAAIGNKDVPIVISDLYPSIVIKYQTPLAVLKQQGTNAVISFGIEKVRNTITNRNFLLNLLFFCFPLGLLLPIILKKKIDEVIIFGVLLNVVVFDSIKLIHIENDIVYVFVSVWLLYLVVVKTLRFSDIFKIALLTFFGAIASVMVARVPFAERFAIWTYILCVVGCVSFVFSSRHKENSIGKTQSVGTGLLVAVVMSISLVSVSLGVFQIIEYGRRLIHLGVVRETQVSYIGPKNNYHQGYAVIQGSGFGDHFNDSIHVMSDYGEIEEYFWSDNSITFRIPLAWNIGDTSVWLEQSDGTKSQNYTIRVLDKSSLWSASDAAYYEELLTVPPYVREANGYTREWYR